MGDIHPPQPVLQLLAAFSAQVELLDWARAWCESQWGAVALASPRFDFVETDYYAVTMGGPLKKQFFALARLASPEDLPAWKVAANAAEQHVARQDTLSRPVNLDPGYLSQSKLVLASTKDHAHRLYVGQGIYAEITLRYYHRAWAPQPWTYPDFRRADYHEFFDACRQYLRTLHAGR